MARDEFEGLLRHQLAVQLRVCAARITTAVSSAPGLESVRVALHQGTLVSRGQLLVGGRVDVHLDTQHLQLTPPRVRE